MYTYINIYVYINICKYICICITIIEMEELLCVTPLLVSCCCNHKVYNMYLLFLKRKNKYRYKYTKIITVIRIY